MRGTVTIYVVTYEDRITEETIVLGVFDIKHEANLVKSMAKAKNQNAYIHRCELNTHYPYEFKA